MQKPMTTFKERMDSTFELLGDTELDISIKEIGLFLYHWYSFEMLGIKYDKIVRKQDKHAAYLNREQTILNARKELNKHL